MVLIIEPYAASPTLEIKNLYNSIGGIGIRSEVKTWLDRLIDVTAEEGTTCEKDHVLESPEP